MTTAHRRAGFSLIELLVVIGIIATLASMLLPAVGLVRASAKSLGCQAHLQQIHAGILGYSSDWRGYTMYSWNVNPAGTQWWSWGEVLATHLDFRPPTGAKPGQFGIFNCPMNTKQRILCDMWGPNAAAQAAGQFEDTASYSGNGNEFSFTTPSRFFAARVSAYTRPADLLAVWDGILARTEPWYNDGSCTVPFVPGSVRGVRYAHRGRTNAIYADGHLGALPFLYHRTAASAPYNAWNSFYN